MGFSNGALLGRIAEVAIVAFAVIIAINQIGIAANLVNILFIGVVAALALAFGLAFGLGGRDVAAQLTQSWYEQSQVTAARLRARETADRPKRTSTPKSTSASVGKTSTNPGSAS